MTSQSKYQAIYRELLTEILAGKYDAARRMPSEAQLVERFGVSRPTISRALSELKSQGILDRKAGSGTFLRKFGQAETSVKQVGMIVPGLGKTEIFDVICGELANLARVHELGIHWGGSARPIPDTEMKIEEAEELCTSYIEKGVSGVFFAPFEHTSDFEPANRRITERLVNAGIPVVLIDRDICGFPGRSEHDLVGIDNFAGGYLLTEHLIKLGCHRLAFVTKPFSAATVNARKAGVVAALMAHDISIPRVFLHEGNCVNIPFVRDLVSRERLDAIICANDYTAAQLLQSLTRLGIKTPEDIRVVGFDDVRFAKLLQIPLTTIQQPCQQIALTAFNAMKERFYFPTLPPRLLLLTPRLVVRESCGAYLHKKDNRK